MCSLKAWHFSCQFDHEIICVNWRYLCMCLFCYGGGFVRTQMQRTKTESSEKRDRLAGRNADRQAGRQARLTGAGSARNSGEQASSKQSRQALESVLAQLAKILKTQNTQCQENTKERRSEVTVWDVMIAPKWWGD